MRSFIFAIIVFINSCSSITDPAIQGASNATIQSLNSKNPNIHYFEINPNNSKDSLILLTGVGTTAKFWSKKFIMCLSQKHQVFVLDYPGIKSSLDANKIISVDYFSQTVNDFVIQQHLSKPTLIGWSMGGSIALDASFKNPNSYKKLYILAGYIPMGENLLQPFPKHPIFTSGNDVFNFVFANNIYSYSPNQVDMYKQQLLSDNVWETFPSIKYTKAQISSTGTWGNDIKNINSFKTAKTPATFIIPDKDTIINENKALLGINQYGGPKSIVHIANSGHDVALQEPNKVCDYINNTN